jgi:putative colanic acid biosynthesis acetyltransferase WcaF
MFAWRRLLLRLFGARLSSTAKVYPGVKVWYPRNLEMHEFSCLGPGVDCYSMGPIVLEAGALVSQRAFLCGGTHDIDDVLFEVQTRPIRLGRSSWVAAEAFVGPGVELGEGAVLGARGVTVKNLAPWTVYAGNPARPLRARHQTALDQEPGQ